MAKPIRGSQRILIRTGAEWTADDATVPLGWWAVSYTGSTLNKVAIGDGATAFSALDDQLGGGGGGAPTGASYVTIGLNGSLTAERVLTAGTGISITDGGANGNVTIAATGGVSDGDKGDITVSGSGATWTIDNGAVTLAKMEDRAEGTLLGRDDGAGTGAPQELTPNVVLGILDLATDPYQRTSTAITHAAVMRRASLY